MEVSAFSSNGARGFRRHSKPRSHWLCCVVTYFWTLWKKNADERIWSLLIIVYETQFPWLPTMLRLSKSSLFPCIIDASALLILLNRFHRNPQHLTSICAETTYSNDFIINLQDRLDKKMLRIKWTWKAWFNPNLNRDKCLNLISWGAFSEHHLL